MAQSSRQKKATKVKPPPTKAEIIDRFNTAFRSIGADMPQLPGADNRTPMLWEYFKHHHLRSYANGALETDKKLLIREGIIFDPEKEQRPVGDHVMHHGVISVTLNVKKPGQRVDTNKLVEYLEQHGVSKALLLDATIHASFETRPAHEFKPMFMLP